MSGGIQTVGGEKAVNERSQIGNIGSPRALGSFLGAGGDDVEQVEFEDDEVVGKFERFSFTQRDKTAVIACDVGACVAGRDTEEALGLQHVRCSNIFDKGVAVVVSFTFYGE